LREAGNLFFPLNNREVLTRLLTKVLLLKLSKPMNKPQPSRKSLLDDKAEEGGTSRPSELCEQSQ
jgi:hypothetical protein